MRFPNSKNWVEQGISHVSITDYLIFDLYAMDTVGYFSIYAIRNTLEANRLTGLVCPVSFIR
jgi:hypothetical protein